jgi:hypothetical protein
LNEEDLSRFYARSEGGGMLLKPSKGDQSRGIDLSQKVDAEDFGAGPVKIVLAVKSAKPANAAISRRV